MMRGPLFIAFSLNTRNPPRDSRSRGNRPTVECQYCHRPGHAADKCCNLFPQLHLARAQVNSIRVAPSEFGTSASPWLLDFGAPNHVTPSLSDLTYHQIYDGPHNVVIGKDTSLGIANIGKTHVSSTLSLSNVLHVLQMERKVIYVSQFCCDNSTSIELFPSCFIVKDLPTRATLHQSPAKGNLYEWSPPNPPSPPQVFAVTRVSLLLWHSRLRHPSLQMLNQLLATVLPTTASSLPILFSCTSCLNNKSHKLSFGVSSIKSRALLDVIFSNVWGPSPVESIHGFRY